LKPHNLFASLCLYPNKTGLWKAGNTIGKPNINEIIACLKKIKSVLKTEAKHSLVELRSIGFLLDSIIPYYDGHSQRVAFYALKIANPLNFTERQKTLLEMTALLHDLGKVGIAEKILLKPLPLTESEKKEIQKHALRGYHILSGFTQNTDIIYGVRAHHERFDGKGYPDALKGESIPLFGRILAVADAYDAMTSVRPYRVVYTKHQAILEITRCAGTQFDSRIAEAFLKHWIN